MKKKIKNILGLTILEAVISTVIVGIGFVAILSMVNYSVQSIDTSGERTKANYLVSMMAEDVIGHKDSIYGVNTNEKVVIGIDGTITVDGIEQPEARKFSDHLAGTDFLSRCAEPKDAVDDTSGSAGDTPPPAVCSTAYSVYLLHRHQVGIYRSGGFGNRILDDLLRLHVPSTKLLAKNYCHSGLHTSTPS